MLAASVALVATVAALPTTPDLTPEALRKYGNVVEACTVCVGSSGLAVHACNCCDSWSAQYYKS